MLIGLIILEITTLLIYASRKYLALATLGRYAAFAIHSPEACTLNNKTNKEIFMQFEDKLKANMEKYGIKKIVDLFVSVPEHHYIIIVEAESAIGVENMCIDLGMAAYNTVKIVPLKTFEELRNRLKGSSTP